MKITKIENGIKISVRVVPNASRCEIVGLIDDVFKIKLDVPPVDGKANAKCVKFLSKLLGVSKSSVEIASGEKSRTKTLLIRGNSDELEKKLKNIL